MGRYDEDNYGGSAVNRQRDLVLAVNEFCFLQNKTNGTIKSHVGPLTMTISQQEALVTFNTRNKKFEETQDFEKAKQLFVSAPEGWYAILKNPIADNQYPESGKANTTPVTMKIGTKVNIPGPISVALYPGQMAKVVRGHRLRSNQYLLARVYDAQAAKMNMSSATIVDAEGKDVEKKAEDYFMGQLLVIKGTEVSFYVPPTGIEVIPVGGSGDNYVRDAVTLERLEYAILKDEDGEKRYVHGPAVVFPQPTETFTETPKGGSIFRALELSPISGIYVKVIAAYKDEDGTNHPVGEELFITGKEQMIYYPRPEHAMIQYDGKYMHHAVAIPEGEGRYILDRLSGKIKTIKGPQMYLPDPRTEVIVKRKLTAKECQLLYPNNKEVLLYNESISEKAIERLASKGLLSVNSITDTLNATYSTSNQEATLAIFEAGANISRGVSYTKPRTITLDTKYDGVVGVDVWTGYAINVVSKSGTREVVVGPTTRLLDYDETLEAMSLSTGRPKTTDNLLTTAFLRVENNKISDLINLETKDFIDVQVKVSYCVNFLEDYRDKWFSIENYVKYMTDRMRSLLKREAKNYTVQEFHAQSTDIIRNIVLDKKDETREGRLFVENGMLVHDVEVLSVKVESSIADLLESHQYDIISKTLELTDAEAKMKVVEALADVERKEAELQNANALYRLELDQKLKAERFKKEEELKEKARIAEEATIQAKKDMQGLLSEIHTAELARKKALSDCEVEKAKKIAEVEKAKQEAYAETIKSIMGSISPDLIAALTSKANASLLETATRTMSPYAIASGESVVDTVDKLLRGTTLEGVLSNITQQK